MFVFHIIPLFHKNVVVVIFAKDHSIDQPISENDIIKNGVGDTGSTLMTKVFQIVSKHTESKHTVVAFAVVTIIMLVLSKVCGVSFLCLYLYSVLVSIP